MENPNDEASPRDPYQGMDSLQILRLWDLQRAQLAQEASESLEDESNMSQDRAEQEEEAQFMIEQGVKENYKKTIYQTSVWQALVFIAFTSALVDHGKEFLELRHDFPAAFYFMFSNQALYVLGFVFNLMGICLVNHYIIMIRIAYGLLAFLFGFGCYGLYVAQQMFDLVDHRKEYQKLYEVLIAMVCIRLFFYALICVFFACFSVFVCLAIFSGQTNRITQHQATLERMTPSSVKKFLKKQAKKFNPDTQCDQCAICLEQFSENDGKKISQLDCSEKHVFHLECIVEWVEKNDICPMCREPIRKKKARSTRGRPSRR